MNELSTAMSSVLKHWIGGVLGPHAADAVLGSITWADLGATLIYVLLALVINGLAAILVRRQMKAMPSTLEPKSWQHQVCEAAGKPLYFLIWACGLDLAATPLLSAFKPTEGLLAFRNFCGLVFDLGVLTIVLWVFYRLTHVIEAKLAIVAARSSSKLDKLFVPLLGTSVRVILPVAGVTFALSMLNLPVPYAAVLGKGTSILMIVAVAVILLRVVDTAEEAILTRFDVHAADNLRARKVYTQVHVIRKMIEVIIGLFTLALVLMLFDEVRHVGASLLASAGIVGIVAGIAAQRTLANLFAGIQIALTQPIRHDDVVVVEGEWGRIEEITLTYVIVHIWDDRRLIVPLSYFIEKPFQNWTRNSANLLGSITVWLDYTFPVEEGREALRQIIESSALWDQRFWNLQVTDANDKSMQLRVLVTSADSTASWDLRCEIREKFIAYIQTHHPNSLPQTRLSGSTSGLPSRAPQL